jgi:hypothetical protein
MSFQKLKLKKVELALRIQMKKMKVMKALVIKKLTLKLKVIKL